jgi:hypothetical protein
MKQAAAATIADPKNNEKMERFGKLIGFDHTPDGKHTDKSTESQTTKDIGNSRYAVLILVEAIF